MNYEIVELKEKTVVGLSISTSNNDPEMGQKFQSVWVKLYGGEAVSPVYPTIKNIASQSALGIYTDYSDRSVLTENLAYTYTAGIEVSKNENPELSQIVIPAGKYAKFSVRGHMDRAVAEAWQQIWQMDLDRRFGCDFEEYLNADMEDALIDIYIAIN